MAPFHLLGIAMRGILTSPLRAVLTVLALSLGLVGLLAVSASATIVQESISEDAILSGGPITTVVVTGPSGPSGRQATDVAMGLMAEASGIRPTRCLGEGVSALDPATGSNFPVTVCDSDLRNTRPFRVVSGDWISDEPALVPRLVLNEAAFGLLTADTLELNAESLSPVDGVVIGVIQDGASQPHGYASRTALEEWLASSTLPNAFLMSGSNVGEAEVRQALAALDAIQQEDREWTVVRTDTVRELSGVLETTVAAFQILALLSLATAGLAAANVNLSALNHRASDFAMRRALGAHRSEIAIAVLLEALLLGATASFIAIPLSLGLLGQISTALGADSTAEQESYPWQIAVFAIVAGSTVSAAGALVPAIRAAVGSIASFARD